MVESQAGGRRLSFPSNLNSGETEVLEKSSQTKRPCLSHASKSTSGGIMLHPFIRTRVAFPSAIMRISSWYRRALQLNRKSEIQAPPTIRIVLPFTEKALPPLG